VGFQPDLVWLKNRNQAGGYPHLLFDAVRGAGYALRSDNSGAELDRTTSFTSFSSSGFNLGNTGNSWENDSAGTYVAWNWKAPTSSNLTAGGNRSIATTSKLNLDAGFEIITYSGSGVAGNTIGHSLGKVPDFIIGKNRTYADSWWVYHREEVNHTKKIHLNLTDAAVANSSTLNNTAPTSSVITLGSDIRVNNSSHTYLMYAFCSVDGYSKVGSYTGNGSSTDGPFVYTGFRPAYVLTKKVNGYSSWPIHDSERGSINVTEESLYTNESAAEVDPSTEDIDFLSNGFKIRSTTLARNSSGGEYIFIAFAEQPFKHSNAR
jgi:hypothetical protein